MHSSAVINAQNMFIFTPKILHDMICIIINLRTYLQNLLKLHIEFHMLDKV